MAIPQPQFGSLFHCVTTCTGKKFPLGHPGPRASHPALVHLRQEPVSISLAAISPSLVEGRAGLQQQSLFWRQLCLGHSRGCQHRGCPAVGPELQPFHLGVAGLWLPGARGTAEEPDSAALGLQLCQGRLCCCALLRLSYSSVLVFPPRQSVRWIRDDLPLVNYITVNVSYITAAPPKIMAKILLTF